MRRGRAIVAVLAAIAVISVASEPAVAAPNTSSPPYDRATSDSYSLPGCDRDPGVSCTHAASDSVDGAMSADGTVAIDDRLSLTDRDGSSDGESVITETVAVPKRAEAVRVEATIALDHATSSMTENGIVETWLDLRLQGSCESCTGPGVGWHLTMGNETYAEPSATISYEQYGLRPDVRETLDVIVSLSANAFTFSRGQLTASSFGPTTTPQRAEAHIAGHLVSIRVIKLDWTAG